ncbi:MAG: T9SS type A sorting domain-containing protein, partial [Bacteroidales bacterium]|nr:T9SS type A sorting domain-containing protein [Bacteroidales bacterium]
DENRFKLHLNVVGLEEIPGIESNILIYAANGNIFIKGAEKGEVRVSDLTGRIVLQQQINGEEIISIPANLKTGIYLVMVQQGKEVKTEKIFIR